MTEALAEEAGAKVARLRLDVCDGRPPSWLLMGTYPGGIEASDPAWTDLTGWVSWLTETYEVTDWPSCWAQHHGLVQELTALRVEHAACLVGTAHECVLWHESLWQFLERVIKVSSRCLGGNRHESRAALPAERGVG